MTTLTRRTAACAVVSLVAGAALVLISGAAGYAFLFFLACAVPLGSAGVLMLWRLTGGAWGESIRFALEPAAGLALFLPVAAIPLALAAPEVYPWASEPTHPYFAPRWVALRAVLVLGVWAVGGPALAAASRSTPPDDRASAGLRSACAAGMIVYVVTVTLGFTDWAESIERGWHSSIFGFLVVCAQALTALAWATALAARRGAPASRLNDLGTLLMALVLLHAYLVFSQFLIIWSGGVPARMSWYHARGSPGWTGVLVGMAALQFALPLGATLSTRVKRSARALGWVCAALLAGSVLEAAWLTLPSAPRAPSPWWAMLALILCGACVAAGAPFLRRRVSGATPSP